ncbi:hypothetical protein SK128_022299 [Halocaridina rubra]|uniref:Uncharacterized protein n=1 Tax=Halocaridina rubra TaxID=373956 RepID=A0AAN8ZXU9_HALRR
MDENHLKQFTIRKQIKNQQYSGLIIYTELGSLLNSIIIHSFNHDEQSRLLFKTYVFICSCDWVY